MRLEPIGVSDLAATGLNPFPIAEPVADVLRASQTATNLGNQIINLNDAQNSIPQVNPTPSISTETSNRRQIQDNVELSQASRNAADPIPQARTQDSLSPDILPEIQGIQAEPVGVAQLSQAEQQIFTGNRLIDNREFQIDLDNAITSGSIDEPQLTIPTDSTINLPDLDTRVDQISTDIEFPPETAATNPRLGLSQNSPRPETTQAQGPSVEINTGLDTPEVSGAEDRSDEDQPAQNINGQSNQLDEETVESRTADSTSQEPQARSNASDSSSDDRGRLLERTYTGSANSTTINESNFVAIG